MNSRRKLQKQKLTKNPLAIRKGNSVVVITRDGMAVISKILLNPWQLANGLWVTQVCGFSGACGLHLVYPVLNDFQQIADSRLMNENPDGE